jgi:hypothetical protein
VLIRELPEDSNFGDIGILYDLPGGLDPLTYSEKLEQLSSNLFEIPEGMPGARRFETTVGEIIRLCFFRALEMWKNALETMTE